MRAGMLAFVGGVIILYCVAYIPPYWLFWILAALLVSVTLPVFPGKFASIFSGYTAVRLQRFPQLALVLMLLGLVSWQLERAVAVFNAPLPERSVSLLAYPCAPPQWRDGRGLVMTLCVTDSTGLSEPSGPVRRLRGILADQKPDFFPIGPHRFTTRLQPLKVPANPGQWRGEAPYLRQGMVAQGLLEGWQPEPLASCSLHCRYHSWRLSLIQRLRQHLPAMAQPGLVEALTLGSRGGLNDSHWQTLQATGTNHLVAISGLHLGMVALIAAWLSHWLIVRLGGQGGPGRPWLLVFLVLAVSGFYALLAGFTVPTRRALVMVLVASVAVAAGRRLRPMDGWLLALVLVLLVDPLAPLDMGFWLSFAAVGCLLLVFANRLRQPSWWWGLLVAQMAVMMGLLPLLGVFDRPGTVMALLANIIAIPLMSVVLMPLLLISLPLVLFSPRSAGWVEPGLSLLLDSLWSGLVWLGERSLELPVLPLPVLLLVAIAGLLANFPVPGLWRRITLLLVLCWWLIGPWQPEGDRGSTAGPQLLFIDSPGLTAVLIQEPGKTALYVHDTRSLAFNPAVPRALQAALLARSVTGIDVLIISHGGLRQWPAWQGSPFAIARVITGGAASDAQESGLSSLGLLPCHRQQPVRWESVTFHFWQDQRKGLSESDRSCVVRIESQVLSGDILLSGDIGREGERRLLRWLGNPARISGLLAPSGGRQGSSQAGWVQQIDPQWVVFSASPHPQVLERYRQQGSQWWYPGEHGAVLLQPGQALPQGYREGAPFWWRRPLR